jgi:Nsp1-like C-terminal region
MTVEQILNHFQQALKRDAVVYLGEARRVAEYDAILRDSQHDLNLLTEQVRRSLLEQQQVEQTLTGVGALQLEIDRTLETVKGHLDKHLSAQSHLVTVDADREREQPYQMALDLDARLQELQQSSCQQMKRALPGEVAQMVRVLHQHQSSLASWEDVARRMDANMGQIHRVFATAGVRRRMISYGYGCGILQSFYRFSDVRLCCVSSYHHSFLDLLWIAKETNGIQYPIRCSKSFNEMFDQDTTSGYFVYCFQICSTKARFRNEKPQYPSHKTNLPTI